MNSSRQKHFYHGHTLMEAMLVLALLGLVLTLVLPNLFSIVDRDVVDDDVETFVDTLRLTAQQAMYNSRSFVVDLDITAGYYTIYEQNADDLYDEDEPLIPRQGLDYSYIQVVEYADGSTQFSGDMTLVATPEGWQSSWLFEIVGLDGENRERWRRWVRLDRMTDRVVLGNQPLAIMEPRNDVSIRSSL